MKKHIYKGQKYKNLLTIRENPAQLNLRILKFKRPKWHFLKKTVLRQANKAYFLKKNKKFNKKLYFYNQQGYLISSRWSNIRFRYKELLLAKRRLYLFFSLKSKLKSLKKRFNQKTTNYFLNKLETRIDILLWRIGVFASPAISRFFLNHKAIKLNDQKISISSIFLKAGDIISFTDPVKKSIKNSVLKHKNIKDYNTKFLIFEENFNYYIPYFIEINWDTLEIICLRNAEELNNSYMLNFYSKNLNVPQFKTYLRKL